MNTLKTVLELASFKVILVKACIHHSDYNLGTSLSCEIFQEKKYTFGNTLSNSEYLHWQGQWHSNLQLGFYLRI